MRKQDVWEGHEYAHRDKGAVRRVRVENWGTYELKGKMRGCWKCVVLDSETGHPLTQGGTWPDQRQTVYIYTQSGQLLMRWNQWVEGAADREARREAQRVKLASSKQYFDQVTGHLREAGLPVKFITQWAGGTAVILNTDDEPDALAMLLGYVTGRMVGAPIKADAKALNAAGSRFAVLETLGEEDG